MSARKRPVCPLCGQKVLAKDEAWTSTLFGWEVHFRCIREAPESWYRDLLTTVGGSNT